MNETGKIKLGFTDQQFEPGVHICQIYNDDDERHDALIDYIISGLKEGENTSCFSDKESKESLSKGFKSKGIDIEEVEETERFLLSGTSQVYFENGKFEPERMLSLLEDFYKDSQRKKRTGARVIGEMTSEVENVEGGSRLMEYESRVSLLLKKYPVNAVCQYDARSFDGSTILDVLKVHPYMIVRGAVVHNPFFIPPEEFLATESGNRE